MNKNIKNFIAGLCSTLVIMPVGAVSHIPLTKKSDAENIKSDWQKIGLNLRYAMNQIDNEQEQ